MPGLRNGGSVCWRFTAISSPSLLLASGISLLNFCGVICWWALGNKSSPSSQMVFTACWRAAWSVQTLLGITSFSQPTRWNSWKDRQSSFPKTLAGHSCPLRCPAAAWECCVLQATARLPQAWELNSVSSCRPVSKTKMSSHYDFNLFIRDEINCNVNDGSDHIQFMLSEYLLS